MERKWIKKKDKYHVWWECPTCGTRLMKEPTVFECPHCKSPVLTERQKNGN